MSFLKSPVDVDVVRCCIEINSLLVTDIYLHAGGSLAVDWYLA